jgi:hypothetical protein
MSMAFVCCGRMLLLRTPNAVLLSVSMGVLGCLWPNSLRSWCIDTALQALMYNAPSSALAAPDMTAFRILETLCTAPLLHGFFGVFGAEEMSSYLATGWGLA